MITTIRKTFSFEDLVHRLFHDVKAYGSSLDYSSFPPLISHSSLFLSMLKYAFSLGTIQSEQRSSLCIMYILENYQFCLLGYVPLCLIIYLVIMFIFLFFILLPQILCIGAQGVSTFCIICRENL